MSSCPWGRPRRSSPRHPCTGRAPPPPRPRQPTMTLPPSWGMSLPPRRARPRHRGAAWREGAT
eukprot:scaffold17212_cov51-Isochrysis_galbana.AAC.1